MHRATYRAKDGVVGCGEGETQELANKAAIIDAHDRLAIEGQAPLQPHQIGFVTAIVICTAFLAGVCLWTWNAMDLGDHEKPKVSEVRQRQIDKGLVKE